MNEDMKMNKKFEGFCWQMAAMDALPVIFFGIAGIIINTRLLSLVFGIGVALCLIGGLGKVAWKLVIAFSGRDINFLFRQMRVIMPAGFILMIVGVITGSARIDWIAVIKSCVFSPAIILFAISIIALVMMIIFVGKLDPENARSNWIEQGTNCVAQGFFMLGVIAACVAAGPQMESYGVFLTAGPDGIEDQKGYDTIVVDAQEYSLEEIN